MHSIYALGLKIDTLSLSQVKKPLASFLASGRFHQIATVNPDFVMLARKDKHFQDVINDVDLALADGVGIHLPAFLQGKELKERIPGSDLTEYLLAYAATYGHSVFLLARADGLSSAAQTKAALLRRFPKLSVRGCDVNTSSPQALKKALGKVRGEIVLSNFGAPLQDTFLAELRTLPESGTRIAMGVGGTFDFFTRKQTRAPFLVRKFGLEWLWRLLLQPRRRLKRTFNYVVVFSLLCLAENILTPWKRRESPHPLRGFFTLPKL